MTDAEHQKTGKESDTDCDLGALLGWTADKLGKRFVLHLQSARQVLASGEEPHEFTYFLKREQAVLLGNFPYNLAGETPLHRRIRGDLVRLFREILSGRAAPCAPFNSPSS